MKSSNSGSMRSKGKDTPTAEEVKKLKLGSAKCGACLGQAAVDPAWRPSSGLDPAMRRYVCLTCGNECFIVRRKTHDQS